MPTDGDGREEPPARTKADFPDSIATDPPNLRAGERPADGKARPATEDTHHVEPTPDGWVLRREGSGRVLLQAQDRDAVLAEARDRLHGKDTRLVIHQDDGSVEREERP